MLNIMYATNETQCVELAYSIVSLLKYNKNVHIFLCTNSDEINPFSEKSIKWLQGVVKYMDNESFLEQIEIKDIYNEYLKDNPNENTHWTKNALTRLLADKIFLPKGISKIFYFDPDVMFTNNVLPLFHKMESYNIAMKRDNGGIFVTGVQYLNIASLEKIGFFSDAIKCLKERQLKYCDQDATNFSLIKNNISCYDFNNTEVFFGHLWEKTSEPLIYHFCCGIPFPVGCVSEEKFVELMPEFSYVKDLLDNYRSSIRFNF